MTLRSPGSRALQCAALGLLCALAAPVARAQQAFENRFTGDLGVGLYHKRGMVNDVGGSTLVLPYVYGDYGRFFARIDTFGVKTLPLGAGHLELVARVNTEGFDADRAALRGVGDRRNPVPIGVGTMQRTPIGAFFGYATYDVTSGGAMLEATWGGRFEAGPVTLYPLLGLEYRSSAFVQHLYGIDASQSGASGYPVYTPGGSTVAMAGLAATMPISGPWALQFMWRHRWLDRAITASPLVNEGGLDTAHVALTYEFK